MDVEVGVDIDGYLGCLVGGFKVVSGIVEWHISSCGTDFDNSEMASHVNGPDWGALPSLGKALLGYGIVGANRSWI